MSCENDIIFEITDTDSVDFDIDVRDFVDRIVAPDEYSGVTVVTPSDETQTLETANKLVRSDITVNPAPEPALEPLTVDTLTQSGTFLPTGDGFSQVTVEEQWDEILYPIEDDPDQVFNSKWVNVSNGDRVIIEGVGQGRWFGFRNPTTDLPTTIRTTLRTGYNDYLRFVWDVDCDCILVLAGYNSSPDGGHSGNSAYQFRGEYLRYKVIHAS